MTQEKPDKATSKPGKKKLTLTKETLRDLKEPNLQTPQVKGGAHACCSRAASGCVS